MRYFNRKIQILIFLFTALLPIGAWGFPLRVSGIDSLNTAILIRDLRFGADLVAENIDRPLIPASVMKSVTVASMLSLADPEEYFTTPVIAMGEIKDSLLKGDLVVKTCGDPTIESQYFPANKGFVDSIVSNLKRIGVNSITGRVIIDESGFPDATTPAGWMEEDLIWPYGARLQGANFRDNRFRLRLPSRETDPYVPDIRFNTISRKGRGVSVDRKDGSETFTIKGNLRKNFSDNFATPYPSKVMQHEIEAKLKHAGIEIAGGATAPKKGMSHTIYEHRSPTFAEIMRSLMYRSDNLMAEGMLRALTPGGTRADAINEEKRVWVSAGINGSGVKIIDGSGLSRDNRLTARFLADIYQVMLQTCGTDYTSLFPRAGYDGTMRYFLANTELEKRVAMKTGSMRGVQSYGGYLFDENGEPTHLIIFIVNNFRCGRAALKSDIQRLLLEKFGVSLQRESQTEVEGEDAEEELQTETSQEENEQ